MFQTFTGRDYLKIDIANSYGLDKKDWDERIAWFDQNEHQLHTLVSQAEEPALFFAGCRAWLDVRLKSRMIGHFGAPQVSRSAPTEGRSRGTEGSNQALQRFNHETYKPLAA